MTLRRYPVSQIKDMARRNFSKKMAAEVLGIPYGTFICWARQHPEIQWCRKGTSLGHQDYRRGGFTERHLTSIRRNGTIAQFRRSVSTWRTVNINGVYVTGSMRLLCDMFSDVCLSNVMRRLRGGMSLEDALTAPSMENTNRIANTNKVKEMFDHG